MLTNDKQDAQPSKTLGTNSILQINISGNSFLQILIIMGTSGFQNLICAERPPWIK